MKFPTFRLVLASTLAAVMLSSSWADLLINEFQAATSNRQLRTLPDGRPRLGWGPGWQDPSYKPTAWETGTIPIGFGFAGVSTDLGSRMRGKTTSLYLRKTFTVSAEDAAKAEPLRLQMFFDDGFIAFINGVEIARGSLGPKNSYIYQDQSTYSKHTQSTKEYIFTPAAPLAKDVLVAGENVLAIQVQNTIPENLDENTTAPDATLRFEGKLYLGAGAAAGGSDIPLVDQLSDWKYFVGVCEPNGGVCDPGLAGATDYETALVDWVELYNNGQSELDLSGATMTDDKDLPKKWPFPAGTKIPAGGYLLVLADGYTGTAQGRYLHANFSLASDAGYLGIFGADGKPLAQLAGSYPQQSFFHSYGIKSAGGGYVYFAEPSPGAANKGPELTDNVGIPKFSIAGGFHDGPIEVKLESKTPGATIRYTKNGSDPSETNGEVYTGPIAVNVINNKTGTVLRARAFKEGLLPSKINTRTYLVGQNAALKTAPVVSLVGDAEQTFYKPNGVMAIQGSVAAEVWAAKTIDDYYMPKMRGRAYERPASLEIIQGDPSKGANVQLDMGLRLAASPWSRGRFKLRSTNASPWASDPGEKPSFNFFFRSEYGNSRLEEPIIPGLPVRTFKELRMRAGKNEMRNPFIRDELARRLFTDLGQMGSVGVINSVYVNGSFKGYFNLVNRLRESFFQDAYGSDKDWDVRQVNSWASGDNKEWLKAEAALKKDLTIQDNYNAAAKLVDLQNLADYCILNIWGATWDWPHNNFVVARERSETGVWRAFVWDAEGICGLSGDHPVTYDVVKTDLLAKAEPVPLMFKRLYLNPEFKLYFADRLQKHFFTPGGALTQSNIARRLEELKTETAQLMKFTTNETFSVSVITSWIPKRLDVLFNTTKQMEKQGLWPLTKTVTYNQHGGTVAPGFEMRMTAGTETVPQAGDIYYTLDGSDPRLPLGAVNGTAKLYERGSAVVLTNSATVKARVRDGASWSPVNEARFLVGYAPAVAENIVISEIMYNPAPPNAQEIALGNSSKSFEYIEIYNASDTGMDLTGLRFVDGIEYLFSEGLSNTISARSYGLLVANRQAFESRYGKGLPILGVFRKELSNGGEKILLQDGQFRTLKEFSYGASGSWPTKPDSDGYSLVLKAPDSKPDLNNPSNWVESKNATGSPGKAEDGSQVPVDAYQTWRTKIFSSAELADLGVSGPNGDADSDNVVNFAEYAFGTNPKDPQSLPSSKVEVQSLEVGGQRNNYLVLTTQQRIDDSKVSYSYEASENLTTWTALSLTELSRGASLNGTQSIKLRGGTPLAGSKYLRLRAKMN